MLSTQKRFLSRTDVARELGLSQYSIDKAIRCGELPATKIAGRLLISRVRLVEWLESVEQVSTTTAPKPNDLAGSSAG